MAALTFSRDTGVTRFREATDRQASMAGVTGPSFVCVRCKTKRATLGRRRAVKGTNRFGFVCAGCAA